MEVRATVKRQQPRTSTDTTNRTRLWLLIGVLKLALVEVEQLVVHEEGVGSGVIKGLGGEVRLELGNEVVEPRDMPQNWGCIAVPSVMACGDDSETTWVVSWREEGYKSDQ